MMKPLVYFFGNLPGGFSSYPEDHTQTFFREFQKCSKNTLQIVVHREGNLLHYGYVRKFNGESYLGLCLCVDRIFTDIHYLFDAFDDIYATIVKQGIVLKINSSSAIEWATDSFVREEVAVSEYSKTLVELLSVSEENTQALPPVDFSIAIDHQLDVSLEMPLEEINEAIGRYPNVYIAKSNAEIERVTNFFNVIREKDKIIRKLQAGADHLKEENKRINRQQKQYRYVAILAFVLFGSILGLLGLNGSLNSTKKELQWTQEELEKTNTKLSKVTARLKTTKKELSNTQEDLKAVTSYSFQTGATMRYNDNHDSGWILWLKAKRKVQLESFYIKGRSSGNVRIGLYNTNDSLIASHEANATGGEFQKVSVNSEWTIDSGVYYMRILDGESLQYHGSSDIEYGQFSGGALEVIGASGYSDRNDATRRTNHSYYQYFYNIQYHIVEGI